MSGNFEVFPRRRALAQAISAILATGSVSITLQAQEQGNVASRRDSIEEVIVTARKREENLQDIPESVIAFTTADIERSGFKGIEDYARFVPSMSIVGTAPGQNKIIFRGLADSSRPFIADPTAAIYLDEQPLTTGAQSPDVRPVDIERIEALSGPQGTLYGASSQSGTLRIITNKPDREKFEANIGVGVNGIDDGGEGYDVDAMVNIPLANNSMALRLVGFNAKDAGYIDNVLGSSYLQPAVTNAAVVQKDHNSADWLGGRASLKWWVNEEWTATGVFNYQKLNTHGFNDYDPTVGDLDQVNFFDEKWDDDWFQGSLIIEGSLGFADLLSATSYFERDTSYTRDATGYAAYLNFYSVYNDFTANAYYANYNFYDFSTVGGGFNASGRSFWFQLQKDKRVTQEIRLSREGERLDWTLGFFYQNAKQRWDFEIIHPGWERSDAFRARNFVNGGTLDPTNVRWNSGERSTREDISIFGESTYRLTDKISLTFGGRWFDVSIDRSYFVKQPKTAPGLPSTPSGSDSGFLPKGGAQYQIDDDKMLYAVYSEGFRSGGINRGRGNPTLPNQYEGDKLINMEAGIKSQWAEGRLQVNVAGYHQVWKDFQLELTDPSFLFGELFQTVVANVGDAVVDGIEFDVTAIPTAGVELGVNGTWLIKAETDQPLIVFDPRDPTTPSLDIPAGQRLPLVADFNASAYAQYSWPLAYFGGEAYVRFQYSYTGESLNKLVADPEPFPQLNQAEYHIGDLKFGFQKETWEAQLYINNIWDERPEAFHDTDTLDRFFAHDNIRTTRPRNFGLRIRKFFN